MTAPKGAGSLVVECRDPGIDSAQFFMNVPCVPVLPDVARSSVPDTSYSTGNSGVRLGRVSGAVKCEVTRSGARLSLVNHNGVGD